MSDTSVISNEVDKTYDHVVCASCASVLYARCACDRCPNCTLEIGRSISFWQRAPGVDLKRVRRGAAYLAVGCLIMACAIAGDRFFNLAAHIQFYWSLHNLCFALVLIQGISALSNSNQQQRKWKILFLASLAYPLILIAETAAWLSLPYLADYLGGVAATWIWSALYGEMMLDGIWCLLLAAAGFALMRDLGQRLKWPGITLLSTLLFGLWALALLVSIASYALSIIFTWQRWPAFAPPPGGGIAAAIWNAPVFATLLRYAATVAYGTLTIYWIAVWQGAWRLRRKFVREELEIKGQTGIFAR